MGLLDVARDVKAGKLKLADVPSGSRPHVQRLLPIVGEAPKPRPLRTFDRASGPTKARTL